MLTVVLLFNVVSAVNIIINATVSNTSGEFYVLSESDIDFNLNIIQCGSVMKPITNCHIICDANNGCMSLNIYAEHTESLSVDCINNDTCSHLKLKSAPSSTLVFNCMNVTSCSNMDINGILTTKSALINCMADNACRGAWFNLPNLLHGLTINCISDIYVNRTYSSFIFSGDRGACSRTDVVCPVNSDCNINCPGSSVLDRYHASCNPIHIHIKNDFYQNLIVNMDNNYSEPVIFRTFCTDYGFYQYSQVTYNHTIQEYQCLPYFSWNPYECCPFFSQTIECNANEPCQVDCSRVYCQETIINASIATSLDINCGGSTCNTSQIICPIGGDTKCTIHCSNGGCNAAKILSESNELSIICDGDVCDYSRIIATNTNILNLYCSAIGCTSMVLLGEYINKVTINCNGIGACCCSDFYFNYSETVQFHARGEGAAVAVSIYSEYADEVIINCASGKDVEYAACTDTKYSTRDVWFLSDNSTINCYGTGCDIDYLYVNNSENIKLNVNGCDQCDDLDDCMNISMYCDAYYSNISTFGRNKLLGTDCSADILNNTKWENDPSDTLCYLEDTQLTTAQIIGIVIGIVLFCCVVIGVIIYMFYIRKKPNKVKQEIKDDRNSNNKPQNQYDSIKQNEDEANSEIVINDVEGENEKLKET